jgi:hypothetical protein
MQVLRTRESQPAPAGAEPAPSRRKVQVATGALAAGALVVGLGVVMQGNASFAEDYVGRQLAAQRITFAAAEALTPEERGTACLVANAGRPLTTGKQAECYANHYVGRHLTRIAEGRTYAEMRSVITSLEAQIAQAPDDPAVADLQRRLGAATGQRRALLEGESVRGMLLTSFGFASLGDKAGQAADVAFLAGGSTIVASLAGLAGSVAARRRGRR